MTRVRVQILGERCSGTHYVDALLQYNFGNIVTGSWIGFRHWIHNNLQPVQTEEPMLIIVVLRNPEDQLRSFYKDPKFAPDYINKPMTEFLKMKCVSYEGQRGSGNKVEEFDNIVQCLNAKFNWYLSLTKLDNVLVVYYDEIKTDPTKFLELFSKSFSCIEKSLQYPYTTIGERGVSSIPYKEKKYDEWNKEDWDWVQTNFDKDTWSKLIKQFYSWWN
jgi:hypothetical protein